VAWYYYYYNCFDLLNAGTQSAAVAVLALPAALAMSSRIAL
jgi:hypothetical protein